MPSFTPLGPGGGSLQWDWELLLQSLQDFILVFDPELVIRYVNRVPAGMTREGLVGQSMLALAHESSVQVTKDKLGYLFQHGLPVTYEAMAPGPDGRVSRYLVHAAPFVRDGKIPYAVLVARDITGVQSAPVPEEAGKSSFEGRFITICAWTHKVKQGDQWVDIAKFLKHEFGIRVSHGISPEAQERLMEVVEGGGKETA